MSGLLRPEFWTNKNTKTAEPYFLREGKSGSALRVQYVMKAFSVPGPKAIAEKLDHDNIKVLIEQYLAGEDKLDLLVWEMTEFDSSEPMVATEDMFENTRMIKNTRHMVMI